MALYVIGSVYDSAYDQVVEVYGSVVEDVIPIDNIYHYAENPGDIEEEGFPLPIEWIRKFIKIYERPLPGVFIPKTALKGARKLKILEAYDRFVRQETGAPSMATESPEKMIVYPVKI